jgi:hypothetical protein
LDGAALAVLFVFPAPNPRSMMMMMAVSNPERAYFIQQPAKYAEAHDENSNTAALCTYSHMLLLLIRRAGSAV